MFDCVIIGAGAAAVGAMTALQGARMRFLSLEAMSVPGGRTRTASLGNTPFDEGASFIHASEHNPWTGIAETSGFETREDGRARCDVSHGRPIIDPGIMEERLAAFAHLDNHIEGSGDSDAASVLTNLQGRWAHASRLAVGPWLTGEDNDSLSIVDFCESKSGKDLFVTDGYGTLVRHQLSNHPVKLNHRVHSVTDRGAHVDISGCFGTVNAKTVIVTISTEHLRRASIHFDPGLSKDHKDALAALPLSALTKVGLVFDRTVNGITDRQHYLQLDHDDPTLPLYLSQPGGHDYLLCFTGGRHGRWLQAQSLKDVVASVLAPLERALGQSLQNDVRHAHVTRWDHDPTSFGSYSFGTPGLGDARQKLSRPLSDRIFMAGEATATDGWWATAAGAYLSGHRAASEVHARLSG